MAEGHPRGDELKPGERPAGIERPAETAVERAVERPVEKVAPRRK